MAVREDGEFELVLGNKQLLSFLFVIVVLLGVFFAMGFIAGRSTGDSTVAEKPPAPIDPAEKKATPGTPAVPLQREPSLSTPPQTSAAPPTSASKPPAEVKPAPASGAGFKENPTPGLYLQVAATRRADAEAMHNLLSANGLTGCFSPVPRSTELFRVLVGPLSSKEATASARTKLEELGIDKPYPVTYK